MNIKLNDNEGLDMAVEKKDVTKISLDGLAPNAAQAQVGADVHSQPAPKVGHEIASPAPVVGVINVASNNDGDTDAAVKVATVKRRGRPKTGNPESDVVIKNSNIVLRLSGEVRASLVKIALKKGTESGEIINIQSVISEFIEDGIRKAQRSVS